VADDSYKGHQRARTIFLRAKHAEEIMSFKDILVYLDAGAQTDARVRTAVDLAVRHKARLVGVDISTEAALVGEERDRAVSLETDFTKRARAAGIPFKFRATSPQAKTAQDLYSHSADLLITTQPHPDRLHLANPAIPKDILLTSGVPMLVLPDGWTNADAIGKNVVIAWNFSREATRALHDAMPILEKAEKVFVYMFGPNYDPHNRDLQDIIGHLDLHGIKAELDGWREADSFDIDAISALFSLLDREDADLIVSGAYGHSPLFEDLFGGATNTLLNNISMPVFMSH
jgi:nucleotide-binding universal stress UspA family protein